MVVASVGTYSGPVGAIFVPILQGAQLWVKHINQRGGLNGHPVQLIVLDDGADPARHRSQVQEAIEKRKIVAFLSNAEGVTGESSVEYVTSKRIPSIGSEAASQWYYESPMYFPQASSSYAVIYTGLAAAANQTMANGKKKLGGLFCAEAQPCRDAERLFGESAEDFGFDYVYQAKVSLAQPDYTGECLAARRAGVEVLFPAVDINSVSRLASSCARQGFRPTYAIMVSQATDAQRLDPNLDGMVGTSNVFPYFQSDTPATQEFQRARATYGADLTNGIGLATGWTSGKLLEKAAAGIGEPPTSEAILRGLWSLKEDTLGGLTHPLTFTENQNAKFVQCWYNVKIENKQWQVPDGFQMHCR